MPGRRSAAAGALTAPPVLRSAIGCRCKTVSRWSVGAPSMVPSELRGGRTQPGPMPATKVGHSLLELRVGFPRERGGELIGLFRPHRRVSRLPRVRAVVLNSFGGIEGLEL